MNRLSLAVLLALTPLWPALAQTDRPVCTPVRVATPPKIDGTLDDACWQQAPVMTGFIRYQTTADPAQVQTEVRCLYDDTALYIAFRCTEPSIATLKRQQTQRDSQVYTDDAVELFIAPGRDPLRWYQFIVNAANVQFDLFCEDVSWNAVWQSATHVGTGEWSAEFAIPWSALGAKGPGEGLWGINFCRDRHAQGEELSAWSACPVSFHSIDCMGYLVLPNVAGPTKRDIAGLQARARGLVHEARSVAGDGRGERLTAELQQTTQMLAACAASLNAPEPAAPLLVAAREKIEAARRTLDNIQQQARFYRRISPGGEKLDYFVAVDSTMSKLCRDAVYERTPASSVAIDCARNEAEGTQISAVPVDTALQGVRVRVSRLKSAGGAEIPGDAVVVNPVGYVTSKVHTAGAKLSGAMPDPLLPDHAMDVALGNLQSWFVTIWTPANQPAGLYRGTITVRPANAKPTRLPLTVRVYDFALPKVSHVRTAFVLWGGMKGFISDQSPAGYERAYLDYTRFLLRYRLTPITFRDPVVKPGGGYDFTWMDNYLKAADEVGFTTFNVGNNGGTVVGKDVAYHKAVCDHLRQLGFMDKAYVYGVDEASGDVVKSLQDYYGTLKRADKDIKTMQTGWSPTTDLQGFVDIWCPLTGGYNEKACKEAQARGEEVWWYVCCGPTAPFANFFVDYPGIDQRILFWQNWKYGVTGFLYWGTDVWADNKAPLGDYARADYSNWNPNSFDSVNGDGYLLYPGPQGEPLASVRLANIRDGLEDYEYFYRLKELADKLPAGADKRAAEALLRIDAPICADLRHYTSDPQLLTDRRARIAEMIERLQGRR